MKLIIDFDYYVYNQYNMLTDEEKREKRKAQLRDAQRRFQMKKNGKKSLERPEISDSETDEEEDEPTPVKTVKKTKADEPPPTVKKTKADEPTLMTEEAEEEPIDETHVKTHKLVKSLHKKFDMMVKLLTEAQAEQEEDEPQEEDAEEEEAEKPKDEKPKMKKPEMIVFV